MSFHDRLTTDRRPGHGEAGRPPLPEHLVMTGLRCWMAGFETADAACWEIAWNEYARELGGRAAKPVITELACWVRCLRHSACRDLALYPWCCRHATADETLAVALVAGCQHGRLAAARGSAFLLLATNTLDPVVAATCDFAAALDGAGLRLATRYGAITVGSGDGDAGSTTH